MILSQEIMKRRKGAKKAIYGPSFGPSGLIAMAAIVVAAWAVITGDHKAPRALLPTPETASDQTQPASEKPSLQEKQTDAILRKVKRMHIKQ